MISRDAASASVQASFVVSYNDRPHPNLLPRGEGTAIACVSFCGCPSGESSRGCLVVQGFKARILRGILSPFGGGRESPEERQLCNSVKSSISTPNSRVFDAGARRTTAGAAVLPNTKLGPWGRSSAGVDHRPSRWLKTQKRLNEPNSKNANPSLNIDDFTNFDFFKK